jgi:single-strand DNA-binding protein
MASFNKITIVGYLGRDPEIRYTPQGTAVCNLSVATTEKRKNMAGEQTDHTTWFRITVWGRQAEFASEYLAKGRPIYIEGRLRQEGYIDREGNSRTSLEVNASDIQFLGRREDSAQSASHDAGRSQTEEVDGVDLPPQAEPRRKSSMTSKETIPDDIDSDIPF